MKKILIVLAVLAVVFGVTACGDSMHNGTEVYITGVRVENISAFYEGKTLYVHEGWMPGNTWDAATPNQGVVAGGVLFVPFGTPVAVSLADFGVQVIAQHWNDKVVGGLADNVVNPYDSMVYTLVVDASDASAVLE